MMDKQSFYIFFLLLLSTAGNAQMPEKELHHSLAFKTQFLMIKDGYNYGLTHRGLNLAGDYMLSLTSDKRLFSYDTEIAFGVLYNQGIGMAWSFKPFDFFYGFSMNNNPGLSFFLGPYLSGYYKWQLYPELQSGHMFWFSSYELGPEVRLSIPLENRLLDISLAGALLGLNSRPQSSPEDYFYSLTFSDFVGNVHSGMTIGSLNVLRHVDLELAYTGSKKRTTIAYEFEYISYSDEPGFQYMTHSINLIWHVGNKNKD